LICSKCKAPRAHRSHTGGLKDWIYKLFHMIPYRCKACQARFYAYRAGEQSSSLRTGEERKVMALRRRMKWEVEKDEKRTGSLCGWRGDFGGLFVYGDAATDGIAEDEKTLPCGAAKTRLHT
jgi:hypothetical protein